MVKHIVATAWALGSASILPAQPSPTPQSIAETGQAQDVRFRTEAADRMTVSVRVSGSGPYSFLVDTGADHTAISRELATRLRLAPAASAELHDVVGVSTVETATVPDLQFSRIGVKIDWAPLLDSANMGADGILGTDTLDRQRIEFDFVGKTMLIMPSAAREAVDEPGTIVIEARRRNGRLIVTDATANGRGVIVVIDTGAELCIGNAALRRQLLARAAVDPSHAVDLLSVTGDHIRGEYMLVHKLEMSGVTIQDLVVVFANAHTFAQLKLDDRPAMLLGMNAMRAFKKVSIDFAKHRFRVVVPEHSEAQARLASAAD